MKFLIINVIYILISKQTKIIIPKFILFNVKLIIYVLTTQVYIEIVHFKSKLK
jgi:hypothetical protein